MTMLNKRSYDERILHVDLSPVLRDDDTVQTITSVEAIYKRTATDQTTGNVTITNISPHSRAVSFKASGGHPGQTYQIRIRLTTNSGVGQIIEGIVTLEVQ